MMVSTGQVRPGLRRDVRLLVTVVAVALLVAFAPGIGLLGDAADAAPAPVVLVPEKAQWSYLNEAPADYPGDEWTQPGQDVSGWPVAPGPFGYNPKSPQVGITTTLGYGADAGAKWPVYLFRRQFQVSGDDLDSHANLVLSLKADDSAIIFINGEPVQQVRYDRAPIDMTTYSGQLGPDATSYERYVVGLNRANLVEGENTVAVAVFQQVGTSSDVTFDLGLSLEATGSDIAPQQINVAFNGDSATRKGIAWQTVDDAASDVRYLQSTEQPDDFDDATLVSGDSAPVAVVGGFSHKVVLTGLSPASTYWYQVGDDAQNVWSQPARLTTTNDDGVVSFSVLADSQGGSEADYRVATTTFAKARELDPDSDFMVQNGDMVDNSSSPDQWRWLYGTGQSVWANNTFVATAGNHDAANNTYYSHYAIDTPASNTSSGAYYSADYDGVHLVVLNTNDIVDNKLGPEQTAWMTQDITDARAGGAQWVVVIVHKGTQSVANHIDDAEVVGMRRQLQPLFDELGVDVMLAGHDHTYTRSEQMGPSLPVSGVRTVERDGVETAINPGGTVYLTANSTGVKFYTPRSPDVIAANGVYPAVYGQEYKQMFANFAVTQHQLTFTSYLYDQAAGTTSVYDEYAVIKDGEPGATTVPAPPRQVTVDEVTGRTARVTWAAPGDDGGEAITGYTVTAQSIDGAVVDQATTGTETTLRGLTPGTPYTVSVVATNPNGSGDAGTTEITTAGEGVPLAPQDLAATDVVTDGATLSWSAPADDGGATVTGYTVTVRKGATVVASQEVSDSSLSLEGLAAGTGYSASVSATNANGDSETATVAFTTATGNLPTPTVTVTGRTTSAVTATWGDSGDADVAEVTIARGDQVVQRQLVPAEDAMVKLTGLRPGTTYDLTVRLVVGTTRGEASAAVAFTTRTGTLTSPRPRVAGKPLVGRTLRVKAGAWTPGTALTYVWRAGAKQVGTRPRLKVTRNLIGRRVTVTVTGRKTGYDPATRTSPKTAKVRR